MENSQELPQMSDIDVEAIKEALKDLKNLDEVMEVQKALNEKLKEFRKPVIEIEEPHEFDAIKYSIAASMRKLADIRIKQIARGYTPEYDSTLNNRQNMIDAVLFLLSLEVEFYPKRWEKSFMVKALGMSEDERVEIAMSFLLALIDSDNLRKVMEEKYMSDFLELKSERDHFDSISNVYNIPTIDVTTGTTARDFADVVATGFNPTAAVSYVEQMTQYVQAANVLQVRANHIIHQAEVAIDQHNREREQAIVDQAASAMWDPLPQMAAQQNERINQMANQEPVTDDAHMQALRRRIDEVSRGFAPTVVEPAPQQFEDIGGGIPDEELPF